MGILRHLRLGREKKIEKKNSPKCQSTSFSTNFPYLDSDVEPTDNY